MVIEVFFNGYISLQYGLIFFKDRIYLQINLEESPSNPLTPYVCVNIVRW